MKMLRRLIGVLAMLLVAGPAYGGTCSNPTGREADRIYNGDYHTYQYCNGSSWIPLSGALASGGGGSGCTNPSRHEGDYLYNGDYHTYQFCNGTAWIAFSGISGACSGCNIFGSTIPATVDAGPDGAVNLGVAFYSEVPGYITGIRFYKAAANTGTHMGNLWSSTGTKLAEVTFTGETASGWQSMSFASPVAIDAYTFYVASYLCPNGHYAADANYFASAETVKQPLHAAVDWGDGTVNTYQGGFTYSGFGLTRNSLFTYGAATAFPSSTFNATNYYVDVLFSQ